MVTWSTAMFNIEKLYVLPAHCVYMFCVDFRRVFISLYDSKWFALINDVGCVYGRLQIDYLSIIQVNLSLMDMYSWCELWDIKVNENKTLSWSGQVSSYVVRIEHFLLKPCKISWCNFWQRDYVENAYSSHWSCDLLYIY